MGHYTSSLILVTASKQRWRILRITGALLLPFPVCAYMLIAWLSLSLFHIVVDTDETASRILEVMVREQLGRVTFMPLNRLRPPTVKYPEQQEEAVPM